MSKLAVTATLCGMATGLAIAACAKSTPTQVEPRQPRPVVTPIALDEIQIRYTEIRDWRRELGLPTDPPLAERNQARMIPFDVLKQPLCPEYPEPRTSNCQDMCSLADHICENAEEICRIAGDLHGNSWAEEKCSSAKASCKEGKKACCSCCADEPEDDGAAETGDDDSAGDDGASESESQP